MKRTIYWHIGLDDLGTAWLGEALGARREELAGIGVQVFDPAAAHDAAVDLLRSHADEGRRRRDVDGAWDRVERAVWRHKGLSVLSTPGMARAERDQLRLALEGLRHVRVHLVLLARDLPSLVHAGWQDELARGDSATLEEYADAVLAPDREHAWASRFWAGHDLPAVLARWTRGVRPDRVHVVALDSPGDAWEALRGLVREELAAREDGAAMPSRPDVGTRLAPGTAVLDRAWTEVVEQSWADDVAARGIDLRGSLDRARREPLTLDPVGSLHEAALELASARAETARLRVRLADLEAANARLDRRRRKLKRRVRELSSTEAAS